MQRRQVASAAVHAAALGSLAAWLTASFANPLGLDWALRDSLFVLAVVVAVFYSRIKSSRIEQVISTEHHKLLAHAYRLERVDYVHGEPVGLETNKIMCLLFFGSWCARSRASLQQLEHLRSTLIHEAIQFVALTQETREELAIYEVKGRTASNFQELKTFSFSIGIEDGLMSKEYLVRCDLSDVPQLFVVAKDGRIMWYGDPATASIKDTLRQALAEENIASNKAVDKVALLDEEQALAS